MMIIANKTEFLSCYWRCKKRWPFIWCTSVKSWSWKYTFQAYDSHNVRRSLVLNVRSVHLSHISFSCFYFKADRH